MAEMLTPERELTRAAVLRVIGLSGPLSRTAIAAELEVSPATITALTRDLLEDGLIEPAGKEPVAARGRPAELLRVVPSAATLLGAKVSATSVTGVTSDLLGSASEAFHHPYDATIVDPIAALAEVLAPHVTSAGGSLLGIGLGVPGVVDVTTGRVSAPTLGWDGLPVGAELSRRFGLPVVVDNDVNTLAVAERLYGRARDVDDALTVTIGRGIGLAITLGGRLHRGAHGGAGEFGHTRRVVDGPRCGCGRRGCLEAFASEPAILAEAQAQGLIGPDATIEALADAADAGDEQVRGVFAAAATRLGSAVADLVNVLAPSLVLISGEGTAVWRHWQAAFAAAFEAQILDSHRPVEVVVDPWDDRLWARGATALLLGSVYAPDEFSRPNENAVRRRLHARAGELDGR
jgi:predicted NBD/HSP70 family sugar kinase